MGTCIPKKLLGYLSRKQKKLESLILITDGDCTYNHEGLSPIDLSAFLCLRKLSWTGMRSCSDMKALRVALKQVSHQLVEFELDFIDKERVKDDRAVDDGELDIYFTRCTLELPAESELRVFPAVKVLSLSHIPFQSVARDMAYAFD
jgi:hypothetical protein